MSERPYSDNSKPGRLDVNGVEWWACDPYPTWYRRDDGVLRVDHAEWAEAESFPSRGVHPDRVETR